MSSLSWYEVATGMRQDCGLQERGEELPAHVVGDDSVLQPKHMQRGDLQRSIVEDLVLLTCTAEAGDQDGKTETEVWLCLLLLQGAEHGHQGGSLAEAQDAVKGAVGLHGFPHNRHALVQPQAFLAQLLSAEAPRLGV